jgi:hypothetical protein
LAPGDSLLLVLFMRMRRAIVTPVALPALPAFGLLVLLRLRFRAGSAADASMVVFTFRAGRRASWSV